MKIAVYPRWKGILSCSQRGSPGAKNMRGDEYVPLGEPLEPFLHGRCSVAKGHTSPGVERGFIRGFHVECPKEACQPDRLVWRRRSYIGQLSFDPGHNAPEPRISTAGRTYTERG